MSLERMDFTAYFEATHNGHRPFRWQERLLDAVLDGGWPDTIAAPTGSGKTAVIDVHVFALALAVATGSPLPPRRLAMIVDRRVLVDDQHQHARDLAVQLADPGGSDVVAVVAELLWRLHADTAPPADTQAAISPLSPLLVARLRGGTPSSRRWVDHPTAAAVVCATPEMWGSRLLFRGYGSGSAAWPREAGLLAVDAVAVVDEAHLAQQLLHTARRVRDLVPVAELPWAGPPVLQVVATTATPPRDRATVTVRREWLGVEPDDLDESETLQARLCRPKPITLVPVTNWASPRSSAKVTAELVGQTVALLERDDDDRTVGCFVNTVARAVDVAAALRDRQVRGRDVRVVLVCGQVRPIDLELLDQRYPGLLSPAGNVDVDVVVSTQSLEVGVDLDLGGIVTELASGSALAQRAGRVNRRGYRKDGPVVVVVPDGPVHPDARSGPYTAQELSEAWDWLRRRDADADDLGLAPWALRDDPAPTSRPRRKLLQRPELGQVWHWARTTDDLAAAPQLDLWLSDDLEPDLTVGLAVRRDLPPDVTDAVELVTLLRPRAHEVFPVPLRLARKALADARARGGQPDADAVSRAVLVRGDDIGALEWTDPARAHGDADRQPWPRIRPGDIVVLDAGLCLFTASGAGARWTPPVLAVGENIVAQPAEDVLEAPAELDRGLRPGEVVHRIEVAAGSNLAELLAPPDDEAEPLDERVIVRDWLAAHAATAMARAAAELLRAATTTGPTSTGDMRGTTSWPLSRQVDVVVQRDAEDVAVRVVVLDGRRAVADEYVRQEWTPNAGEVLLDVHQRAVARRATLLAERVGLPEVLTTMLEQAALHHDDGKADPRFQVRLGARRQRLLAKSHDRATPEAVRRRLDRSGLPPLWRHEQRSIADAWPTLPVELDRELIARLIGTTHGHGRTGFPHTATELLHVDDRDEVRQVAVRLFDQGGWDELVERTERRYGAWTCAYLEALLRAADGQISAEGS
jgi:CRISPR-associated endonuclease/helicase Cas3